MEQDSQTVFSQLDMLVPEGAMVDATTIDETILDMNVKNELASVEIFLLQSARSYRLDQEFCSYAVDALALVLLPAIFDRSQDSLYKDIINRNPWVIKMLLEAHKSETYHHIRRLSVFRSLPWKRAKMTIARREFIEPTQEGKEATVKSWEKEFLGSIAMVLHGILRQYMTEAPLYARAVPHVQSSGTGKSRTHDELAKCILYIPLNLAGSGTTSYPPRDPEVQQWFSEASNSQQLTQNRCHAFLHALLSTALSHLREICDEAIAQKIETDPLVTLASEFRNRMAEGRTFEAHGAYRTKFYEDVIARAEENTKAISRSIRPSTPSNTSTAPLPLSPKYKLPVSAGGSKGRDAAGQPKSPAANKDKKMAIKTRPLYNDDFLTIVQVAEEIIHLLDPQKLSNASPHVVICWDESHSLIEPVPNEPWTRYSELRRTLRNIRDLSIMSIFLSTAGEFHNFSPSPEYGPSARTAYLKMLPPITEITFDQFAEKVDCIKEVWSLAHIASTYQMVHLGRALFPVRFDNGDSTTKNSIVSFAADKLLCRSGESTNLKPDESLACLVVRLGLDFKATSWLDRAAERNQVECHMRLCLAATAGFRTIITISPSEPLLAEASWKVMRTNLSPTEAPRALLMHINESYLNAGDRGEVIAALLLLLARDKAIRGRKTCNPGGEPPEGVSPKDFKYDGVAQGRIVTVLEFVDALVPPDSRPFIRGRKPTYCSRGHSRLTILASAFAEAYIYFNHFIKVHDFKMVNREYLWRLICRGAAVICANNHRGIDILIPVLMGSILRPQFVTAIFVQVKNDHSFTNKVCELLFTVMNPFKVGLFSKDDAKAPALPPVLRIVLALASERSVVTGPSPPVRRTPRLDEFTAYDIWIAGVSSQSFGVIPDEDTHKQYRLLLDRARNIFNGYGNIFNGYGALRKDNEFEDEERSRIELKRMMHAAVASEDQHHQNYIGNLARVPAADEFVVAHYIKELVGMDVDESEPVDGDEEAEDVGATSDSLIGTQWM